MEKISSFCIDHRTLLPGIYLSRTDGDINTYDLRFIRPNTPPFLTPEALHTTEHLFATMIRNGEHKENIIYFGPMGCQTGFYLIVRNMEHSEVIALIKNTVDSILLYEGGVPGASGEECGNYKLLDLESAKKACRQYKSVVSNYDETEIYYK